MIQPELSPIPGKNQYILLKDYRIEYGDLEIVVPEGFIYDGASIPVFGWWPTYTPFHPDVMVPALIHDWLFLNHQTDRKMADDILYDLLILNGANRFKTKLMYRAVRIGGGRHWDYSQENINDLEELFLSCKDRECFDSYRFPVEVIDTALK